jgi:hypothetical protein
VALPDLRFDAHFGTLGPALATMILPNTWVISTGDIHGRISPLPQPSEAKPDEPRHALSCRRQTGLLKPALQAAWCRPHPSRTSGGSSWGSPTEARTVTECSRNCRAGNAHSPPDRRGEVKCDDKSLTAADLGDRRSCR